MDLYRVFGWLIPGLCMAGSIAVAVHQNGELKEAQNIRELALNEVQTVRLQKLAVEAQIGESRFAAAETSDLEQTLFLSDLRARVAKHGAVITNWTSQAAEYGKAEANSPTQNQTDPKEAALLKGVVKVSSTLTLSGPYSAIRGFLRDISSSDRLFTLSRIAWSRTKDGTILIVTISRYVAASNLDRATSMQASSATVRDVRSVTTSRTWPNLALGPSGSVPSSEISSQLKSKSVSQ